MFRPEKAKSWPPIVVWSCGRRPCGAYVGIHVNVSETILRVIITLRPTFRVPTQYTDLFRYKMRQGKLVQVLKLATLLIVVRATDK